METVIVFVEMESELTLIEDSECVSIIADNGTICYVASSEYITLNDREYSVAITDYSVDPITNKVSTTVKKAFVINIDDGRISVEDDSKIVMFEDIHPTMKNVIDLLNNNFRSIP